MTNNSNKGPPKNIIEIIRSCMGFKKPLPKKDSLPAKSGFNIWYLLIPFLFISLIQHFFLYPKVEPIPYSKFKQYVTEGKVSTLNIDPEKIRGRLTDRRVVLDKQAQLLSEKKSVQGEELRAMLSDSPP